MTIAPGAIIRANDLDDTGVQTLTSVSAAANWELTRQQFRRWGPVVQILVEVRRINSDLNANASGNIAGDPDLFTLTDAALRPAMRVYGGYAASVTAGSFRLEMGGVCSILDGHTNSTISVGNYVRVSLTYFIA